MSEARGDGMVGRKEELAGMRLAIDAAQRGRGGLLIVAGEAGIGKSRLLRETADLAVARGLTALTGRAVEGGGAFRPLMEALVAVAPAGLADDERLAPYRGVLARLIPGWLAVPGAVVALTDPVVVLGEAVIALLGVMSAGRGVLLLLDDLHWVDRDTVALLGYLAGRPGSAGILVVGAARNDEPGVDVLRPLRGMPAVSSFVLERLDNDRTVELARRRSHGALTSGMADLVLRASDGLPLMIEELVAGIDPADPTPGTLVPPTVMSLTESRLAGLGPAAQDVVRTAAVLGGGIDWELLPLAGGNTVDEVARALRAAVEANLLVLDPSMPGGLRWRHALTRDAVLDNMLPAERAVVARRAASALTGGGVLTGDRLALAAELSVLAGERSEAARLMLELARHDVDQGALRSAEDALRRALALADAGGNEYVDLTVELVRVLALAGRAVEAEDIGFAVIDRVHEERRLTLCLHLARAAVEAERFDDAGRHLQPVAQTADARVDALRAHVALGRGDLPTALRIAAEAIDGGERQGRPTAVCEALEIVGRGLRRRDPAASEAAFARAERLARQHGLLPWRIRALSELGAHDLLRTGRSDRLEEARRLAVDAGMLVTSTILDIQLSACVLLRDGPVAALPWALRAVEHADRLGLPGAGAAARQFVARGRLFAGESFEDFIAQALTLAPDSPDTATFVFGLRGVAAWLDRDREGAVAALDRAVAPGRDNESASATPFWGVWALLRTLADPNDFAPGDLRRSGALVNAGNSAALMYLDAVAAARAGDQTAAQQLFTGGDEELAGYPFWRHLLHLVLAEQAAVEGFGRPEKWMREALAYLETTHEVRLTRLCRGLMRSAGMVVPRSGRAASVPPSLRQLGVTPREAEVLGLVRDGLSNPEIATQLYLSTRTVETHVAALLVKTGVGSRRRLAAGETPQPHHGR